LAQIVDIPYESLKEGVRLHANFRRIRTDGESGQIHYGFKFGRSRMEKEI